jgi:DNA phosphorothioation-associated DGQHR protein 1
MDKNENNYLEINALKVKQPLGDFFVISIDAEKLLNIAFSEPLKYVDNKGNVKGSQRPKNEKRLKEIGKYIESVEMAFPNSIILTANYNQNGQIVKNESDRWKIVENKNDGTFKLVIPKKQKLAAIIDGQHRLNAFDYVENKELLSNIQLVCSVYFDLPNSYQAFLFATINSNQKKVDRSLALEQFGYNVDDEPEKSWTPEKLAVFLSRKLNTDTNSPLHKHIKVAPLNYEILFDSPVTDDWVVSTATIVDGIAGLISTNPKRDRILMQQKSLFGGRTREMLKDVRDSSPLRQVFLSNKDLTLYNTVINYFNVVEELFWKNTEQNSYIFKTVGIQALFDVLKFILKENKNGNYEQTDFRGYLSKASNIDFTDKFFQSSGIGRGRIKNSINVMIGLLDKSKIKKKDLPSYELIFKHQKTETEKEKWLWEEEAENKIMSLLENSTWSADSKTVSLYLDYEYENLTTFSDFDSFWNKLIEIAEITFSDYLPSDNEFAEEQKEKFDSEDLIRSLLIDYEDNLKRIGWK